MNDRSMQPERHDRSLRFMQQVFPWTHPPEAEQLLRAAGRLRVTIRLARDAARYPADQLMVLALANLILRLPVRVGVRLPPAAMLAAAAPYKGATLEEAVASLAGGLDVEPDFDDPPEQGGVSVVIQGPEESREIFLRTDGWQVQLGHAAMGPSSAPTNAVAVYGGACCAGAEVVRAWARSAAALGASPGRRFEWDTAPMGDTRLNLWTPGSLEAGPPLEGVALPAIDWVGAGAVTQAALAVLAAVPGLQLSGRVFDPKDLDEPDLNRSILSFVECVGMGKASISVGQANGGLAPYRASYPVPETDAAAWIVCGADAVSVRPKCQAVWPATLMVVSTEGAFARVSCHWPDSDTFCAACPGTSTSDSTPIPTIGPTSVFAGVVAAASLLRLVSSSSPPCVTALTLRLDSSIAVEETSPRAREDCPVCGPAHRRSQPPARR
jgi:hypothetical protein